MWGAGSGTLRTLNGCDMREKSGDLVLLAAAGGRAVSTLGAGASLPDALGGDGRWRPAGGGATGGGTAGRALGGIAKGAGDPCTLLGS